MTLQHPLPFLGITDPRENRRANASDNLVARMQQLRFVLPRNAIEWRTADGLGQLPGILRGAVRLVATDGILAIFVLGDGETTFEGHLANFVRDEEPKDEGKRTVAPRGPRVSKKLLALAEED